MSEYQGRIEAIPEAIREEMRERSWRDDPRCPRFDELALLRLPYRDMAGREALGELVVARAVSDALRWVFGRLYEAGFPIARMERVDAFGGDDHLSMAANNCSAFNFRVVEGTDRLSGHALGLAVDINPVQNPWVRGERILPPAGRDYLDRFADTPGLIRRPGPVVEAFEAIGWEWGGDWEGYRDYHHFQA